MMSVPLWQVHVKNVSYPDISATNASNSPHTGNIAWNNAAPETINCQIPGEDIPFPSCYTWPQIILFAFFMAIVMFVIVFGNLLVVISIMTNASLKTVQNYLLVSLAMADCMVGALIMPFSLAHELMGYWAFGDLLCNSWLALDVLLCTASILSLCAISLDRYWSVTQAVTYLARRTPRRAALMIVAVWVSSLTISVPPLLGWRNPPNATEIFIVSNGTVQLLGGKKSVICSVGEDLSEYVIFSSLGSFWIPLALMSVVYVRIYAVARSRASGPGPAKTPKKKPTMPSPSAPVPAITIEQQHKKRASYQSNLVNVDLHAPSSTITSSKTSERRPLLTRPNLQPDVSDQHLPDESSESRSPSSEETPSTSSEKRSRAKYNGKKRDFGTQTDPVILDEQHPSYINDDEHAETSSIMLLSEYDFDKTWKDFFDKHFTPPEVLLKDSLKRSISNQPNGTVTASVAVVCTESIPFWRRFRQLFSPFFRWSEDSSNSTRGYRLQINKEPQRRMSRKKAKKRKGSKTPIVSDLQDEAERRKRRIQKAKERRATLVVTLVIATFVACWMPFFTILPLQAICGKVSCPIHPKVFATVFWLGYFNSALNPVIYTIFNRDFRRAFMRVLLGNHYGQKGGNRQKRGKI